VSCGHEKPLMRIRRGNPSLESTSQRWKAQMTVEVENPQLVSGLDRQARVQMRATTRNDVENNSESLPLKWPARVDKRVLDRTYVVVLFNPNVVFARWRLKPLAARVHEFARDVRDSCKTRMTRRGLKNLAARLRKRNYSDSPIDRSPGEIGQLDGSEKKRSRKNHDHSPGI